jgi:hypothetical protein
VNYAEDIVTITGSKCEKEKKRQSEVKGSRSLDDEIEDNRSSRKKDRGQLSKWKNPPLDALEQYARRRDQELS